MKFTLVGMIFMLGAAAQAEVMLRVRPHVVVQPNSEVRLAQLVDAQGLSESARAELQAVSLSLAPSDGERQQIANAGLTTLLRPIVQAERGRTREQVHLVVPKTVIIDTLRREIDADEVRAELLQAWQPLCSDCRLEIEGLSVPRVAGIRDWSMRIAAELPRGSFSVPVEITRESGAPQAAWVSGRLLTKKKVPVATRLLNSGDRLQARDVAWEYRDTSFAYDGIPREEDLVGKSVRQGLRAGDIVWTSLIAREKAISRGDLVTVKSGETGWEVSMTVLSTQDAYVGDLVNLKHPKTNAAIVGKVVGQREVELR